MILFWSIRRFSRAEKRFIEDDDKISYLDTDTLDPITKAAIELLVETGKGGREIFKYRHLFVSGSSAMFNERVRSSGLVTGVGSMDCYEDEEGNEISIQDIIRIQFGHPNAVVIPPGVRQHDIDYMISEPKLLDVSTFRFSTEQADLLGYFVRDYEELVGSEFLHNGAGTLTDLGSFDSVPVLQTAVTEDEIRSFLSIFRRLYMAKEPSNYLKAIDTFESVVGDHPLARWVLANGIEYNKEMKEVVNVPPFAKSSEITFTRKRLIDVFLYTQFAHQPDAKRQRQFRKCLQEVGDRKDLLTWMFLSEVWKASLQIQCCGKQISQWFKVYCKHHEISPDVLPSVAKGTPGIGANEKEAARQKRLYQEKAKDLATEIWKQNERPEGGPMQFLHQAKLELAKALG